MSESEKPKRKFWQFHLRTAVLATLTAGGLLFLNCIGRGHNGFNDYSNEFGFPWVYFGYNSNPAIDGTILVLGLVLDLIFCAGALLAVAYASEYPLRLRRFRREARNP